MLRGSTASSKRRAIIPTVIFLTLGTLVLLRFSSLSFLPSQGFSQTTVYNFAFSQYRNSDESVPDPVVPSQVLGAHSETRPASGDATHWHPGQNPSASDDISSLTDIPHPNWNDLQADIKAYIQWDRPNTDHWPAWHEYDDKDYDVNRWEGMEREYGYFVNNTVPQLEAEGQKSVMYEPYPKYNSKQWKKEWKGQYVSCSGPTGATYGDNVEDLLRARPCDPEDFPAPTVGSFNAIGLDNRFCFDRNDRYSAYGWGGGKDAPVSHIWKHMGDGRISWGKLQDRCFKINQNRFAPKSRVPMDLKPNKHERLNEIQQQTLDASNKDQTQVPQYHHRTAVLIRTWEGYAFQQNDIVAIRAMVTELSLLSGGEYQVYLLVNVKQRDADIYNDDKVRDEILKKNVPPELQDIAVLWTEKVLEEWYPRVGDWQVYWQQFMPLQWFSKTHPEFDYIWNWETDARYIGSHYHFLQQISNFAKKMPRKHLWERNARFYVPSHHGTWQNFLYDTDNEILKAKEEGILEPVWGALPYAPYQYPLGPEPPHPQEEDNFEWGVDEEADLITLQPIWDPAETGWAYRNHIWNYIPQIAPVFTPENPYSDGIDDPGFPVIPRRVFINTQIRMSKRLLNTMHEENSQGRSMQAEMWPATVALQHGLKAVYAPHPVWTDRKWPGWYADAVFNANDNTTARWGQQQDSPYNHDRECNFRGWSWYFHSVFPHVLYRRWLGWKSSDWGWDSDQVKDQEWQEVVRMGMAPANEGSEADEKFDWGDLTRDYDERKSERKDVAGRMCMPGMLLHPVKSMYEEADGG